MAKKTKVTQRSREEQWRRRVEQQSRQGVATQAPIVDEDLVDVQDDTAEYMQAEILAMPSGVETSARSTTTTAPRTPRTSAPAPATARRTAAAARASRLAFQQTMSLEEEMTYVRSDIRQLVILSAICFAILIALAFVIQ